MDLSRMFNFLNDYGNYEERAIDRYEGKFIVDTCAVSDASKPYETGVSHPDYNGGKWIIVDVYDTKEEAQIGHNRWVEFLLKTEPDYLTDVSHAVLAELLGELGVREIRYAKNPQG